MSLSNKRRDQELGARFGYISCTKRKLNELSQPKSIGVKSHLGSQMTIAERNPRAESVFTPMNANAHPGRGNAGINGRVAADSLDADKKVVPVAQIVNPDFTQ